jgi:uncharacterized protein with HEPN domain
VDRLPAHLHAAREAGRDLARVTADRTRVSLDEDRTLALATQALIGTIGRAIDRALEANPDIDPDIPDARRFVACSDHLLHEYDRVDPDELWEMAVARAPKLPPALDRLLTLYGPSQVEFTPKPPLSLSDDPLRPLDCGATIYRESQRG